MTTETEVAADEHVTSPGATEADTAPHRWNSVHLIAFRFCCVYVTGFCLLFAQILFALLGVVGDLVPPSAIMWQLTTLAPVLEWVARTVFGVDATLHTDSGSGDQTVIWVLVFCLLVFAALVTVVWSVLDRGRGDYRRLAAWFLLFVRICLAGQMLFYGFAKLIPSQMGEPSLTALLQPYGDFSPASVLWLQVGSSPVYEMLLGSVEVLGGLLLFWNRTATLGALVSLVAMIQVFLLNMTFDVPVKILSFHLVVLSLVLLAPQIRNLLGLFVLNRPAATVSPPELFTSARRNRWATMSVVALGVWVTVGTAVGGYDDYQKYGGGAEKPALYGIWEVQEFRVDGKPLPPLTTDETRWQRLVFDTPEAATVQLMDGTLTVVPATVDAERQRIDLPPLAASFGFDRPVHERLLLTGTLDGRPAAVRLVRADENAFTLRSRGFHWIQEEPYFR